MIEAEKYRAVIFDLDGTLYDNKGLPLKLVLGDIRNMWKLAAERKARKAIKGIDFGDAAGVYDALFNKMAEVKKDLTPETARRWYQDTYMPLQVAMIALYFPARPLVIELLEAMRARDIRIILYSDYGHEAEKVEALGIPLSLFDGIVSAAKTGGLKPCRVSMERLAKQFELDSDTTLYVGDREDTDGICASVVGMQFYNVKSSKEAWDNLLKAFL